MLWSFATLRYNPLQGEFVRVAHQRLLPLCEDMDSSDITKCLTSLAKMKVNGMIQVLELWAAGPDFKGSMGTRRESSLLAYLSNTGVQMQVHRLCLCWSM